MQGGQTGLGVDEGVADLTRLIDRTVSGEWSWLTKSLAGATELELSSHFQGNSVPIASQQLQTSQNENPP